MTIIVSITGAPKFLTLTKSLIGIIMFVCVYIVTKITCDCLAIRSFDNNSVIRNLLNIIVSGKMFFLVF